MSYIDTLTETSEVNLPSYYLEMFFTLIFSIGNCGTRSHPLNLSDQYGRCRYVYSIKNNNQTIAIGVPRDHRHTFPNSIKIGLIEPCEGIV